MDKSVYQEHFDLFSRTFHYDNDITIVPNHHREKWDPNDVDLKQLILEQNEYLQNITVVPIYNLKNIYTITGTTSVILYRNFNSQSTQLLYRILRDLPSSVSLQY